MLLGESHDRLKQIAVLRVGEGDSAAQLVNRHRLSPRTPPQTAAVVQGHLNQPVLHVPIIRKAALVQIQLQQYLLHGILRIGGTAQLIEGNAVHHIPMLRRQPFELCLIHPFTSFFELKAFTKNTLDKAHLSPAQKKI